jgi:hypothetical protein
MQNIPLQATPNQILSVLLDQQSCQITLTTRFYGLYFDLSVGNQLLRAGVICQNQRRLIRYPSLGFTGDFWFVDTLGSDDPFYSGLGSRFLFQYIEESDLVAAGLA